MSFRLSPSSPEPHPGYRADIDGLRAIAIAAVVGYHAYPSWINGGFIGVDIFFVISGFLITSIIIQSLQADRFSYLQFYARRIRRIFPALILVLSACAAFGWFTLLSSEYKQLGRHIRDGSIFISNFTLWGESGYFDGASNMKPLLHLWSLGIEEQFYIVWPVLLGLVWRLRVNSMALISVVAMASFSVNIYTSGDNSIAAFYSPLSRFWELMTGGLLAYMNLYKPEGISQHSNLQSWVGMVLVVLGFIFIDEQTPYPSSWALLPTLGAAFCISAGPNSFLNRQLFSNKLLVWLGLISYPLYLWHWPLLSYANILMYEAPSNGTRFTLVVSSVGLAWITYTFLERPIRTKQPIRNIVVLLCIGMVLIFCSALIIVNKGGLDFRAINQAPNFEYDMEYGLRHKKCFVDATDQTSGANAFSSICSGNNAVSKSPLVFLWGDSHAASLYRGIATYERLQRSSIYGEWLPADIRTLSKKQKRVHGDKYIRVRKDNRLET